MGIVVPALIWVIFHLRQRDLRVAARRVPWIPAALLFLVVATPWYLATLVYDGPQFLRTFFLHENLARFAAAPREGHGFNASIFGHLETLCIYPLTALLILFPCSAFLAGDLCSPFAGNEDCRRDPLLTRLRRFAWIWLLAVIGLFSLSKTQLPNYILAIAGGGVILFTLHLLARVTPAESSGGPAAAGQRWAHAIELFLLTLLGLLFSLLPVYVLGINKMHDVPLSVTPLPQPGAKIVIGLSIIIGILFQFGLWYYRRRRGEFALFALGAWVPVYMLFIATGMLFLHSEYARVVQVGEFLHKQPAAAQVVVYHKNHPQNLVFLAQRTVAFYTAKQEATTDYNAPHVAPTLAEELQQQALAGHSVLLVTSDKGLNDVRRFAPADVLQHFGAILVARITPQAYINAQRFGKDSTSLNDSTVWKGAAAPQITGRQ